MYDTHIYIYITMTFTVHNEIVLVYVVKPYMLHVVCILLNMCTVILWRPVYK